MNIQSNRRTVLKVFGASVLLAGCQTSSTNVESTEELATINSSTQNNSLKNINLTSPSPNTKLSSRGFTPQFFDGKQTSKNFLEIGFSLHCGATRDWFKSNGKELAKDIKSGTKAVLFSHVIRSHNELPVAIELMKVGQENYPAAVYATIGLAVHLDRPISAKEVKLFLKESGFKYPRGFSKKNSEIGLLGLHKVYKDGLGVTTTPYIKESKVA